MWSPNGSQSGGQYIYIGVYIYEYLYNDIRCKNKAKVM